MRIRTIKPCFFTHEALFEAEKQSKLPLRVAFTGLWCAADREGRFKWETRRLGVQILPYDNIDFSRVLDALMTRGFIRKYDSFGVIPSFPRHQVINNRERESELPEPPPMLDPDASATREPRDDHATLTCVSGREGNGREWKGMERIGKRTPAASVDEFLISLKTNPAYTGIDIDRELGRMDAWLLTPKGKGRKKTPQFILNWMNRAEPSLPINGTTKQPIRDRQ